MALALSIVSRAVWRSWSDVEAALGSLVCVCVEESSLHADCSIHPTLIFRTFEGPDFRILVRCFAKVDSSTRRSHKRTATGSHHTKTSFSCGAWLKTITWKSIFQFSRPLSGTNLLFKTAGVEPRAFLKNVASGVSGQVVRTAPWDEEAQSV